MSVEEPTAQVIEITQENFEKEFPAIEQTLIDSNFVAFDLEFTGIDTKDYFKATNVDTFETRYSKTRQSIESFFPLQLGLSCFKYNDKAKRFDSTIYNIFMTPYSHSSIDNIVSLRPRTIEFLKSNHFDFNKSFIHGVSSLRRSDEKRLLDEIESSFTNKRNNEKIEIPKNLQPQMISIFDKVYFTLTLDQIKAWVDTIQHGSEEDLHNLQCSNGQFYLVLDPVNSFVRRLIYQEVPLNYGEQLSVVKLDEDNKGSKGNIQRLRILYNKPGVAAATKAMRVEEVVRRVGVRRILEVISTRRLPVVGFEALQDLMYLYHWCEERLPATCEDFVRQLQLLFPMIVDVGVFCRVPSVSHTFNGSFSLQNIFKSMELRETPAIQKVATTAQQSHDAGFDAYMTGVSLIQIAYKFSLDHRDLRDLEEFSKKSLPANNLKSSVMCVPIQLQHELNRLHLFNLPVSIPMEAREFKQMEGELETARNSKVLLASEFEKSIKSMDIIELMRPYFGPDEKMSLIWLNDDFVLLSFPSESTCQRVMEEWRENGGKKVEGKFSFGDLKLEGFEAYERLCGLKRPVKEGRKRAIETEQVLYETKRIKILKKQEEGEKRKCSVM